MGANEGHSEQRANEQARTARHPNAQRPRGIHRSHTYVPYYLHLIPHRMITAFLAGTRRWRLTRGAATRRPSTRAGARIVGFELVFPLIYRMHNASTCLSSYPACSSEPRRVASMIRIAPAPAPYLTVVTFLSLTETQLLFGLCLRIQRPAAVAEGGRERLVQRGRAEHEPVVAWQLVQLGRHAERPEPSRHLA